MYYKYIMDFLKKHNLYDEKMIRYILDRAHYIDYYDSLDDLDIKFLVSCGANIDKKTKRVKGIELVVPNPVDYKTSIIFVHELVHCIIWYKYMNKKYKDDITYESLPFLYERLFIEEYKDKKNEEFIEYLDSSIDEQSSDAYKFALYARDYLYENYNGDILHMEKLSKKLVKKYKKDNR